MTQLRIAADAEDQIGRVDAWWVAHRPASPDLFAHELADALELLVAMPSCGTRYGARRGVIIRRLLLDPQRPRRESERPAGGAAREP